MLIPNRFSLLFRKRIENDFEISEIFVLLQLLYVFYSRYVVVRNIDHLQFLQLPEPLNPQDLVVREINVGQQLVALQTADLLYFVVGQNESSEIF